MSFANVAMFIFFTFLIFSVIFSLTDFYVDFYKDVNSALTKAKEFITRRKATLFELHRTEFNTYPNKLYLNYTRGPALNISKIFLFIDGEKQEKTTYNLFQTSDIINPNYLDAGESLGIEFDFSLLDDVNSIIKYYVQDKIRLSTETGSVFDIDPPRAPAVFRCMSQSVGNTTGVVRLAVWNMWNETKYFNITDDIPNSQIDVFPITATSGYVNNTLTNTIWWGNEEFENLELKNYIYTFNKTSNMNPAYFNASVNGTEISTYAFFNNTSASVYSLIGVTQTGDINCGVEVIDEIKYEWFARLVEVTGNRTLVNETNVSVFIPAGWTNVASENGTVYGSSTQGWMVSFDSRLNITNSFEDLFFNATPPYIEYGMLGAMKIYINGSDDLGNHIQQETIHPVFIEHQERSLTIAVSAPPDGGQYSTSFTAKATVYCNKGDCGDISTYLKFCQGSGCTDYIDMNSTTDLSTIQLNPDTTTCTGLHSETKSTCIVSWTVEPNAEGIFRLNVVADSDLVVFDNKTDPTPPEISITGGAMSIIVTDPPDAALYNSLENFPANATISCDEFSCGSITAYLQYCSGTGCTDYSNVAGTGVIKTGSSNPQSPAICANMNEGDTCWASWTVNADAFGDYRINVLADSDKTGLGDVRDDTPPEIEVYAGTLSIAMSEPPDEAGKSYDMGGNIFPAGTITCSDGECGNVSVYILYCKIPFGEESCSDWQMVGTNSSVDNITITTSNNPFNCSIMDSALNPTCDLTGITALVNDSLNSLGSYMMIFEAESNYTQIANATEPTPRKFGIVDPDQPFFFLSLRMYDITGSGDYENDFGIKVFHESNSPSDMTNYFYAGQVPLFMGQRYKTEFHAIAKNQGRTVRIGSREKSYPEIYKDWRQDKPYTTNTTGISLFYTDEATMSTARVFATYNTLLDNAVDMDAWAYSPDDGTLFSDYAAPNNDAWFNFRAPTSNFAVPEDDYIRQHYIFDYIPQVSEGTIGYLNFMGRTTLPTDTYNYYIGWDPILRIKGTLSFDTIAPTNNTRFDKDDTFTVTANVSCSGGWCADSRDSQSIDVYLEYCIEPCLSWQNITTSTFDPLYLVESTANPNTTSVSMGLGPDNNWTTLSWRIYAGTNNNYRLRTHMIPNRQDFTHSIEFDSLHFKVRDDGVLGVNIVDPPDASIYELYQPFNMTANVTCSGGDCGEVTANIRYCLDTGCALYVDPYANTDLNLSLVGDVNYRQCNIMDFIDNSYCLVEWNVTGRVNKTIRLNTVASSNITGILNATDSSVPEIYVNPGQLVVNVSGPVGGEYPLFTPFILNGTITCTQGFCSSVTGYAINCTGAGCTDYTQMSSDAGEDIYYTSGTQPISCGDLHDGQICDLYEGLDGDWDFTAKTKSVYRVDILAHSAWEAITDNQNTTPIELNIGVYSKNYFVSKAVDIDITTGTGNTADYSKMNADDNSYFSIESNNNGTYVYQYPSYNPVEEGALGGSSVLLGDHTYLQTDNLYMVVQGIDSSPPTLKVGKSFATNNANFDEGYHNSCAAGGTLTMDSSDCRTREQNDVCGAQALAYNWTVQSYTESAENLIDEIIIETNTRINRIESMDFYLYDWDTGAFTQDLNKTSIVHQVNQALEYHDIKVLSNPGKYINDADGSILFHMDDLQWRDGCTSSDTLQSTFRWDYFNLTVSYYLYRSSEMEWETNFTVTDPVSSINLLNLTIEGHYNVAGTTQRLHLYNFNSPGWDQIGGDDTIGTSDISVYREISSSISDYIDTDGTVRVRVWGNASTANLLQHSADIVRLDVNKTTYWKVVDFNSTIELLEDETDLTKLKIETSNKWNASLNQQVFVYNFNTPGWEEISSYTVIANTEYAITPWQTTSNFADYMKYGGNNVTWIRIYGAKLDDYGTLCETDLKKIYIEADQG